MATKDYLVTKNIEGDCGDCIFRVQAWKPVKRDPVGWVGINVISNNVTYYHSMWRNRVKNAWKVLRNTYDWSGFELNDRAEAEAFSKALRECIEEAFPNA